MSLLKDIDTLENHYQKVILPSWKNQGFDASLKLPIEALQHDGKPLSNPFFRAMACARQLYIYSHQADSHAHLLFESLLFYFQDKRQGGWLYSVDSKGQALNTNKDLYTHAFIIFACAEYYAQFQDKSAKNIIYQTFELIFSKFSQQKAPLQSCLDQSFSTTSSQYLQNPLMHLTEALIAAQNALQDQQFNDALTQLLKDIEYYFLDKKTGCISEYLTQQAPLRIEPGHQFEWLSLLHLMPAAINKQYLSETLQYAYHFCLKYGISQLNYSIYAALNQHGKTIDTQQRIWAQTEYIRYLAIQSQTKPKQKDQLSLFLQNFLLNFIQKYGWIELRDSNHAILRKDMPSTTPYHILTALIELKKIL